MFKGFERIFKAFERVSVSFEQRFIYCKDTLLKSQMQIFYAISAKNFRFSIFTDCILSLIDNEMLVRKKVHQLPFFSILFDVRNSFFDNITK